MRPIPRKIRTGIPNVRYMLRWTPAAAKAPRGPR
jgi:hypothetical protein